MARKIEVIDYRPEWAAMFKEEAKKIKKILGKKLHRDLSHRKYVCQRYGRQADHRYHAGRKRPLPCRCTQ